VGLLDEVSIYDRALSANEAAQSFWSEVIIQTGLAVPALLSSRTT
jgi:hypothetical protein